MKILFISPDYLKSITPINDAVDENIINGAITTAQDMVTKVYLGSALYRKLINDVTNDSLTGGYSTIMENFVKPMTAWAAMEHLHPFLVAKMDNGNIVQRVSEDTQPIGDNIYQELKGNYIAKRQHYVQDFIDYMAVYGRNFPEYLTNTFPDRPPKRDNYKPNSMTFSRGNNAMSSTNQYDLPNASWNP